MEVSLITIESVITYHTQEGNKYQIYFGHCPGRFEVALGSLSNSLGTTGFCTEICALLYAEVHKMIHLLLLQYETIDVITAKRHRSTQPIGIGSDFLKIVKSIWFSHEQIYDTFGLKAYKMCLSSEFSPCTNKQQVLQHSGPFFSFFLSSIAARWPGWHHSENTIRNAIVYNVGMSILTKKCSCRNIGGFHIKSYKNGLLHMTLLHLPLKYESYSSTRDLAIGRNVRLTFNIGGQVQADHVLRRGLFLGAL